MLNLAVLFLALRAAAAVEEDDEDEEDTWCELSAPSSSWMIWLLLRKLDAFTSNTFATQPHKLHFTFLTTVSCCWWCVP